MCSFDHEPVLHRLEGSLSQRIEQLERMEWGMNTNLDKVFDLVLGLAKLNTEQRLPPERMVRTIFIFRCVSSLHDVLHTGMQHALQTAVLVISSL